jgi:hypothetical protein
MSFKKNEYQQININDAVINRSSREIDYLKKSWAHQFSELVFSAINEDRFSVLYSDNKFSRPNTPVNVIIGALILKEMRQLTDEELIESILFDVRFQYALHTTSLQEQPVSDRTFSRFRERLLLHEKETGEDLMKEEMLSLAGIFVKCAGIETTKKRMDSLMVATNCRKMSQLDLVYTCVEMLVKHAAKQGVRAKGFEKYLNDKTRKETITKAKSENVEHRTNIAINDGFNLLKKWRDSFSDSEEFKALERCLQEQSKTENGKKVRRFGKEVSSSSMKTPHDPDATFRTKAGKQHIGYTGNFVETVDDCDGKNETIGFITDFAYAPNNHGDSRFCKETIERMEYQENKTALVADAAYFNLESVAAAEKKNVELIVGTMVGNLPKASFADFVFDEQKELISECPAHNVPLRCTHVAASPGREYSERYALTFNRLTCEHCANRGECCAKFKKDTAEVSIHPNSIRRARYLRKMTGDEYRKLLDFRAGVEGIPSILRRKYRVDKVPVRGFLKTKLWYTMKIGAINATRMIASASAVPILRKLLAVFSKSEMQRVKPVVLCQTVHQF